MDQQKSYLREKKSKVLHSATWVEWCLIISVALMPYTSFKVLGPVGPSELLMLCAFVNYVTKKRPLAFNQTFISQGYFVYFCVCALGSIWNIVNSIILGQEASGNIVDIAFDMFSYVFIIITINTFEMHERDPEKENTAENILKYIIGINCFLMPLLFLVSRFRPSLMGMPLMYHDYFTPFAKNLHHTSMYLLPLSFSTIFIANNGKTLFKRIVLYVFSALFMYLAISTGSAKAGMGVYIGIGICIFYKITTGNGIINRNAKYIFMVIVIAAIFFLIFRYNTVREALIDFFKENDLGGGRESIWGTAINKWHESPILGYGFGAHVPDSIVPNKYWDAHNSFITALLQGGAIGCIVFAVLWIKIFSHCYYNGYIFAVCASIFVYVSGGDILRRIPNWSFLILCYYIIIDLQQKNISIVADSNRYIRNSY